MSVTDRVSVMGKRVLVIGATGVLGSRVVPALTAKKAIVRVLVSSHRQAQFDDSDNIEVARGSLFDQESLIASVRGVDIVLHLASRIPAGMAIRKAEGWAENDRVRDQGTLNLVQALKGQSTSSLIIATVCGSRQFPDEHWSIAISDTHDLARSSLVAESHLEQLDGLVRWTALRFGRFVGRSIESGKLLFDTARMGLDPFTGFHRDPVSLIHIDDAASAVLAATESDLHGGFAVPGCTPEARGVVSQKLSLAMNRRALIRLPSALTRLMLGVTFEALSCPIEITGHRFAELSQWNPVFTDATEAILAN